MAKTEMILELNLKTIAAESREVGEALIEFADNLERIEKKYADATEEMSEPYKVESEEV